MSKLSVISLLESVLGKGRSSTEDNLAFHCPFCHHHKPKLEINFTENKEKTNPWQCWVCGKKGKTIKSLFKQINASSDIISQLKPLIGSKTFIDEVLITNLVELPKEFKHFDNTIISKHALNYLKKRNITEGDILKYNIGYCEYGLYSKMIIIPSYDNKGNLNYFTARSFEKDPYIKYRNPEVSRDIIAFELFVNWDLPIILCEGPFDALAIKRNVIPLFGKNIQSSLMKKLVESKVQKIYIALDNDAIKQALGFCEQLLDIGKEVYLVELQGKDPSEMGFEHFTKLIQTVSPLTQYKLMEKKLSLI